ncbi:MAG: choice-of-anchor D domain-containing protein, partial [Kofleriaceae bacterium]
MRWSALLVVWVLASARGAHAAGSADVQFGSVDVGTSAVRYMTATSTSFASDAINNGTIVGGHWFTFAVPQCDGVTSCFREFLLTTTATVIPFRCSPPPGATGIDTAQVQFSGTNVFPVLVCSASGGMLAITPPTSILDFGATDLDLTASPTSTITITNVGTAAVTLTTGNFTLLTGPVFTTSSLASTSLAPGAHLDLTVTYTPVAERTADAPDLARIGFTVIGPTLTPLVLLTLRGHGVDRHAVLQSVAMEPETFVKPGPHASLADIVIANTGGAPLGLYNPAITNGPVWTLANPEPADVPGFGTFIYQARFAPSDVTPSSGTFTVMTTDPDVPMLTATISGTGKTRDVMMGPPIDMQYVAVGTTATISEGTRGAPLQVTNLDPINAFQIHTLFALSNEFEVIGARDVDLPAGGTVTFDVSFTPDHVGAFDATAILLLDDDPDPAATIALHGEGVAVETRGGGGCSTGGDASGGAVLLIALLVMRRRRVVLLVVATATAAHADTRNLDLSIFDPTPSTGAAWFQVQDADVGREGDWAASALVSYASDPLVLRTTPNDNVAIQDRTMFELGGAFAFGDRFEAAIRFPLYLQSGENLNSTTMFGEPAASGAAAGNLAFNAKARLWRVHSPAHELVIGTAATLALPTETADEFAGSAKPQLDVLALVSFTALDSKLSLAGQAGAVVRATALFHDVDQGNGLVWGIGGSYRIQPNLAIESEVFGEVRAVE